MENNEAEKISLERKAIETKNAHNQINTDRKTALTNLNILLSILVPTVPNRLDNFYPRIMRELLKQINDNDLNDNVELIAFFDNKKRTIGKKRGEMVVNGVGC